MEHRPNKDVPIREQSLETGYVLNTRIRQIDNIRVPLHQKGANLPGQFHSVAGDPAINALILIEL